MAWPEISPEKDTIVWLRNKINTLRNEVESMKSDGISGMERDVLKKNILKLKNEIRSEIGDNSHELYSELIGIIDDVKKIVKILVLVLKKIYQKYRQKLIPNNQKLQWNILVLRVSLDEN